MDEDLASMLGLDFSISDRLYSPVGYSSITCLYVQALMNLLLQCKSSAQNARMDVQCSSSSESPIQGQTAFENCVSMSDAKKGFSNLIQELEIPKPYSSIESELGLLQRQYFTGSLTSASEASSCLWRLIDITTELRAWSNSERRLRVAHLIAEAGWEHLF
jgi:hypothetical protein